MADDDIRETVNTETASAVVPPGDKPDADAVKPTKRATKKAEPNSSSDIEPSGPTVDSQQMAQRGRRTAEFSRQGGGKPGRPRAPRAGGHVMTKDGWKLDKKSTNPQPGKPQVTFRKGEGSTIQNAGGFAITGARKPEGKGK